MAIRITDHTMTLQAVDRIEAAAGFRQHTAASGHGVGLNQRPPILTGNRPGNRKAADSGIGVGRRTAAAACLRG